MVRTSPGPAVPLDREGPPACPTSCRCRPTIPGAWATTGSPAGSTAGPGRTAALHTCSWPRSSMTARSSSPCSAGNGQRTRPPGTGSPRRRGWPAGSPRSARPGSWTPGIEAHDPYLVTEYVPGSTLVETVWREGPLTSPGLDAVAIGTATGLMAIHQTGLVHGSLGPDRVVLGPDGPCVTHFGITPPYGAATPAADLLAWANTVLFAALGRPPVGPQDLAALPEDLREVVAACLAPDPAARPVARAVLTRLLQRARSVGRAARRGGQAGQAARPDAGRSARPTARPRRPGPAPASSYGAWPARCACWRSRRGRSSSSSARTVRPPGRAALRPAPPRRAPPGCPRPCPRPGLPPR